jgi:hypothetical protein
MVCALISLGTAEVMGCVSELLLGALVPVRDQYPEILVLSLKE